MPNSYQFYVSLRKDNSEDNEVDILETVFLMLLTNWKGEEKYSGQWVETGVEDRSKRTPHHTMVCFLFSLD